MSLKDLANNVLKRDTRWDTGGTIAQNRCPTDPNFSDPPATPEQRDTSGTATHPDLPELSEKFRREGRIRIETVAGEAWLVSSYERAGDLTTGAVYSTDMLPMFVELTPEQKLEVHEVLSGLGGGQFHGVQDVSQ